ncbi:MAG: phasin family protein [Massilia sp.]
MSTLPEQFSAARKSQVDAQLRFFESYASTAVENAEKIFALNLSTTRASMAQSSAAVQQLWAVRDPRDLLAFTSRTQENFDNMLAYGRQLFDIASASQVALLKQTAPVVAPPTVPEPVVEIAAALPAPVPVPVPAAKPKAIAKAVKEALPEEVAPALAEPQQADLLAPKARKKK